jgi:hypothetical protein
MTGAEQALAMVADIGEQLDAVVEGKPMQLSCAALALTLAAQLKAAQYPGIELIDKLEQFVIYTTVVIGAAAEKELPN